MLRRGSCWLISVAILQGCATKPPPLVCDGTETTTDRFFIQQVSHSSAILRWRGDAREICYGDRATGLQRSLLGVESDGHWSAYLTNLSPNTTYYYSVGGAPTAPMSQTFVTAPAPGEDPADGNVRVWIIGDSGTAAEADDEGHLAHAGEADAVRDGYQRFNEKDGDDERLDLFVQLGDTAYPAGTDEQWQQAFFDVYPKVLKSTMAVPTIGNHGMGFGPFNICLYQRVPACDAGPVNYPIGGASKSSDPMSYDSNGDGPDGIRMPYLDIFELPANAELGGVASDTEQYYSMDYGPLHLVSLDSQLATQDVDDLARMRDWLVRDLTANALPWTMIIFHHPPYSKGENHDSDREVREIVMRETFAPVFEDYGVDVVYSGHAHSFERSWYLRDHHGPSETFDAELHAELDADGKPSLGQGSDPYRQVSRVRRKDDSVVYTVAGNAGHVTFPRPCSHPEQIFGCTGEDWLSHPAHRSFPKLADDYRSNGINRIGSVVVDVNAERLMSRLIDAEGNVLDYFVIVP